MTKKKKTKKIEDYNHKGNDRVNNPPIGLVTPENDPDLGNSKYSYDPHLDPQLIWANKYERESLDVNLVSLHVHERIEPKTILDAVRKKEPHQLRLTAFFGTEAENPPLREAIEFYKHKHNWSNRLIAGDSLLIMNSLIQKEGLSEKIQMIYFDPPYGIQYSSNFQPFINKQNVRDKKDEDLTQEPEMIKAFRDTWELGVHSYLNYIRDRLFLAFELLSEEGSLFFQISDENAHRVRMILDEIFGAENFVAEIPFRKKTMPLGSKLLESVHDYILWYAKNKSSVKYRPLFKPKNIEGDSHWNYVELPNVKTRVMTKNEITSHSLLPEGSNVFRLKSLYPAGLNPSGLFTVKFKGKEYNPPRGKSWLTTEEGMKRLLKANRITLYEKGDKLSYILKFSDYPVSSLTALWSDTSAPRNKRYVVETNFKVIERCLLMTTDPGDLVLDPTCGSGTTAYVAEKWGRRWITCDTSRIAITLSKQRLLTSIFNYYKLAHPEEGVSSGFIYETVPHITLKSIAHDEPPHEEILYDKCHIDETKVRVSGPFTTEAVPSFVVKPISEMKIENKKDFSIARKGETLRQQEWRDELLKTGILGKNGERIGFSSVEPLAGTRWLHANAETKDSISKRVVVSFGPEHSALDQRQVAMAIEEAQNLVPRPKIVIFASFHFDPEASKDIDETQWPGVTLLKVQMNIDLLTDDLKKKRASNESFLLIGQPDVILKKIKDSNEDIRYRVEISGFDYYNPRTGLVESGGPEKIAMWLLDTDYDGRSLFPQQIFFPMAGPKDGWYRLAKTLKAEIDEELIEAYRGTISGPFKLGSFQRLVVKIIDDRGIESLKIIEVRE